MSAPTRPVPLEPAARTTPFVHPGAHVEEGAALGAGTAVWHGAHVCAGAVIGARCVLGHGCYVGDGARVGDGCRIQNHVSLYRGVILERDVFVGPSVVFTNVARPRATRRRAVEEYAVTRVGDGATIGANATIRCGVAIGPGALVGAGAVVTRDVPAHALSVGVPARVVGWVCVCGEDVARGAEPPARAACRACGLGYVRRDGGLALDERDAPDDAGRRREP